MYNTPRELRIKYSQPTSCHGCALHGLSSGYSIAEGTGVNKVLLVGEALGAWEEQDGLPFRPHADAGSVLERAFRTCGFSRDQFALYNILACRPPGNKLAGQLYEFPAIRHCTATNLKQVFDAFQPNVIVALGAIAFRTLTGCTGERQTLSDSRGYPILTQSTEFAYLLEDGNYEHVPVVGTLHPSYIVRGAWNMFPVLCRDLKFAVRIAKTGVPKYEFRFNEDPSEQDLLKLYEHLSDCPDVALSIDFETENYVDDVGKKKRKRKVKNEQISQINLSPNKLEAMALVDWHKHTGLLQKLFMLPNRKIGHNFFGYDLLVGKNHNFTFAGPIDDGMLMFHHLQPDLPGKEGKKDVDEENEGEFAPMQFVCSFTGFPFPWKFMSAENPRLYGCYDGVAAHYNDEWLTRELKAMGLYEGYLEYVADLMPVLVRMSERGIPVNEAKRQALKLKVDERQRILDLQIQSHIKAVAPQLIPANNGGLGYKKEPKDKTGLVQRSVFIEAHDEKCKCVKVRKNLELFQNHPNSLIDAKGRLVSPAFDCTVCDSKGFVSVKGEDVVRWVKESRFNPSSGDQLLQYALTMGYDIPASSKAGGKKKDQKKSSKVTFDYEVKEKIFKKTKDELFGATLKYGKNEKYVTTYVIGFEPGPVDNCVHSQFMLTPANGQLSSVGPNVQNVPNVSKDVKGGLAAEFNDMIEAKPGYEWLIFDYKSFHAKTLGLVAGCQDYIRLAAMDVHSYLTAWLCNIAGREQALSWDDEKLKAWLKDIKKKLEPIRNKQAKPGILGYGLGLGAGRLFSQNDANYSDDGSGFKTIRDAQFVIDTLDNRFDKLKRFRDTIPIVAYKQGGYLKSAFGCIRWFFDIQHYDSVNRKMTRGRDWEKAISFPVQNTAFCMIKRAMIEIAQKGFDEKYGLVNQVHDDLKFHCPIKYRDNAIADIIPILEKPFDELIMPNGKPFFVEVEAKVGKSWLQNEVIRG